jgi:putative Ca2+/H+ antiporter (TMEM165/GDT1 family)
MLFAFLVAAIVIFIAEQGDKTQILALALAAKYRAWQVLLGIFFVNLVVLFVFTLVGRFIGSLLPDFWLWIVSGIVFIGFGALTLRSEDEQVKTDADGRATNPILIVAGLFLLAEIGDQAELITMAIAANPRGPLGALGAFGNGVGQSLVGLGVRPSTSSALATFVGVWLGAVVGIMLADGLAVTAGRLLGQRLPERALRRASGSIFIIVGIVVLGAAVWSRVR